MFKTSGPFPGTVHFKPCKSFNKGLNNFQIRSVNNYE